MPFQKILTKKKNLLSSFQILFGFLEAIPAVHYIFSVVARTAPLCSAASLQQKRMPFPSGL